MSLYYKAIHVPISHSSSFKFICYKYIYWILKTISLFPSLYIFLTQSVLNYLKFVSLSLMTSPVINDLILILTLFWFAQVILISACFNYISFYTILYLKPFLGLFYEHVLYIKRFIIATPHTSYSMLVFFFLRKIVCLYFFFVLS